MMELPDYLRIVRRRWAVLLAGLVLGLGLAAYQVQSTPTTYTATSTVYVSMATGTSVADVYQGGLAAQQRVRSYLELVASDVVVDRVIGQLSLRTTRAELREQISADSPPATALLNISVTDSDPEQARVLTDEVVSQFRALVDQLETIEFTAAPAARVAVVDRAERPAQASGPLSTPTLALGAVAGLLLGAAVAYLLDRADRKLRTTADLSALAESAHPVLGTVALDTADAVGLARELRQVRARLPESARTVLVTGLGARSEPRIVAGLANSLAASGRRVLIIDADTTGHGVSALLPSEATTVGDPVVADDPHNASLRTRVLDLRAIPDAPPEDPTGGPRVAGGLAAVLRGEVRAEDAVGRWAAQETAVLALGDADIRTADLLASPRWAAVLAELGRRYDHILIGVATPSESADAVAVAPVCASTVGVVVLRESTGDRVSADVAALVSAGARFTGVVAVRDVRTGWTRGPRRAPAVSPETRPAAPAPAVADRRAVPVGGDGDEFGQRR